jgi:hypothetical protein
MLANQLASLDALQSRDIISPWVFHRPDGAPIRDFNKHWKGRVRQPDTPHAVS